METLGCVLRVALLIFVAFQRSEGSKTIIFVSTNGNDSQSCGRQDHPCLTLDFAISRARPTGTNSTQISIAKGNYKLKHSYTFKNVKNFELVGQGAKPDDVKITCETNASLSFNYSQRQYILRGN